MVYLLAEWLDTEPFGVLTLRGVERADLLARVSALQRGPGSEEGRDVEEVALEDALADFFTRRGPLPELALPAEPGHRALDDLDAALLGPGGDRAVERLRRMLDGG